MKKFVIYAEVWIGVDAEDEQHALDRADDRWWSDFAVEKFVSIEEDDYAPMTGLREART